MSSYKEYGDSDDEGTGEGEKSEGGEDESERNEEEADDAAGGKAGSD